MTYDAMHYSTRDAMVASLDGCPQRGSTRSALATALSSTAALDSAASAWHVMPCITRRLPTSWQRALGTRAALSSTVAQQLHSVMQLQHGILCHALLDGYPQGGSERWALMPRLV